MASTCFSSQSDVAAVSDLRAWSEQKLIASARGEESSPFEQLCERHMKRVFCVTRHITPNREDAADAVQDCFLNAFVHLKDFDGRSQFATWLTRIAINAALTKLRNNHWKREIPMNEPNAPCEFEPHSEIQDDSPDPRTDLPPS